LPTSNGVLNLYITGVRVLVADADATNYLDRIRIFAHDYDGFATVLNEPTDRTAAGEYDTACAATDVSAYNVIAVYVECVNALAASLDFRGVLVHCYYA
jgi:hypothetical protein